MKALILLALLTSAAFADPAAKKVRLTNVDTDHLTKVMVDLVVQWEWVGCTTLAMADLIEHIPDKLWSCFNGEDVDHVMGKTQLEYLDILWLRSKIRSCVNDRTRTIERAGIIARLEANQVYEYLFDGII